MVPWEPVPHSHPGVPSRAGGGVASVVRVGDDRDTELIEESRRIRAVGSRIVADSAALMEASRAIGLHHATLVRPSHRSRAAHPGPGPGDPLP